MALLRRTSRRFSSRYGHNVGDRQAARRVKARLVVQVTEASKQ